MPVSSSQANSLVAPLADASHAFAKSLAEQRDDQRRLRVSAPFLRGRERGRRKGHFGAR